MRKLLLLTLGSFAVVVCATLSIPLLASGANGACASQRSTAAVGPTLADGGSALVGASVYGGPGDPTSGTRGYRGDDLTGRAAFAELSTNWQQPGHGDYAALGNLPYGTRVLISVTVSGRRRSVIAEKLDVGLGGPPIQGHPRAIDLWWQTANALGLDGARGQWTGLVRVQRTDAPATVLNDSSACAASVPAGPLAQRIVAIARQELAKGISEPGNNCVPYNHCDGQPWCASFVSYVWEHAGVPMPYTEASNEIWTWASQHATVLPPNAQPEPGDAILYGTGPQNTQTSVHVGIVEAARSDGRITTIEGNFGNRVSHNGPFNPRDAQASGEPGPVYAFARPTQD